jgi:hypothetical protein
MDDFLKGLMGLHNVAVGLNVDLAVSPAPSLTDLNIIVPIGKFIRRRPQIRKVP